MAKLTDRKRTVEITMATWEDNGWTSDWSDDFFAVGNLEYDEELEAFVVQDVGLCIEFANDWKNGVGDFADERYDMEEMGMEFDEDNRLVIVSDK